MDDSGAWQGPSTITASSLVVNGRHVRSCGSCAGIAGERDCGCPERERAHKWPAVQLAGSQLCHTVWIAGMSRFNDDTLLMEQQL